jgi:hypothetical protein
MYGCSGSKVSIYLYSGIKKTALVFQYSTTDLPEAVRKPGFSSSEAFRLPADKKPLYGRYLLHLRKADLLCKRQ